MMNLVEFSFKKRLIVWVFLTVLTLGGIYAYFNLARFEDPEFTIKEAVVTTPYPGATPREVEHELTDRIESAIQQLPQVKRLTSTSMTGLSEITVEIKDQYTSKQLPQIWDELRRKVNDIQNQLPPGAGPSRVNDDYGDVYGIFLALTGDGYSYKDLYEAAKSIRKQLLLVPGVAKVRISGRQPEQIFVNISQSRLAQLGLSPESIFSTLRAQNAITYSGGARVGDEYVSIFPTGGFDSVTNISNLLVRSDKSGKMLRLGDVAQVTRGYKEVPDELMYFNGKPALAIGVSILSGGNMVKVGEAIDAKLKALNENIPVGIQLHSIYQQPEIVKASVNGFVLSLLEALLIVVVVLLFFMGFRSGIVIGLVLLLTVLGTLLVMQIFGIALQRISLGALVIALGMLVDNAIVVVEGILVGSQQGKSVRSASVEVANKVTWPLFGATWVGILAFAGIAFSPDSTGEYTRSLFYVVLISLMLSWVLALTAAPLLSEWLIKPVVGGSNKDPYRSWFFKGYKGLLTGCLRRRWITVIVMIALLGAAIMGFGYVKQSFFPDSTTPLFYVNYWRAEGTDIRATAKDLQVIEKAVRKMPHVEAVTSLVGQGAQRFMLVYAPEKPNSSYGQLIVRVDDYHEINQTIAKVRAYLAEHFPDSEPTFRRVRLGPGKGEDIETRLSGPDPKVLRQLAEQVMNVMHNNANAVDIRTDWRHQVKVIKPIYSEQQARATGVSRADLSDALAMTFSGLQVGLYHEGDELIPIMTRSPDKERLDIASIKSVQLWSPVLNRSVSIGQVVQGFKTVWQNARIKRRNRILTITASCNPKQGLPSVLFGQLKKPVEAIKLPPGYKLEWGGEYENSKNAQAGLAKVLPLSFLAMILVVIFLFNAIRQPLIIWLTVPLSVIGVTIGLLVTASPFDFMALLGFLSLSGMLIKNAIVLIDQIDEEIAAGKPRYQAIVDSALSRMRPVSLAAITTVLGMIPLLFDAFFKNMSITIMFGLGFATVLTLIVVPVLYAIFFRIREREVA